MFNFNFNSSTLENKLDRDYQGLLKLVLDKGVVKEDRTGVGTKSIFGATIRHDMDNGFPALTTKKLAFNTMVTELKWFLKGDTNIKYLLDNNCHIWDDDAYRAYCKVCDYDLDTPMPKKEFIDKVQNDPLFSHWGELGPIYGSQWRYWDLPENRAHQSNARYGVVDQIHNLIKGIIDNPDSRRHLVSAWNPADLTLMALPPCHYAFQCYVANGKVSLIWNQRSADLFLGVPFNISSYALLLELICTETGYDPGELIGNFGDLHLYSNHWDKAEEQLKRDPYDLPKLGLTYESIYDGNFDAKLIDYKHHPAIKAKLNT
jgi:thymidylate synthase